MKKLLLITSLLLVLAVPASATVLYQGSFENGWTPFASVWGGSDIVSDSTAPDGTHSLRVTFPAGYPAGSAPDVVVAVPETFAYQEEVYIKWWVKYSSNWTDNPITNKMVYIKMPTTSTRPDLPIMGHSQYGNGIWAMLQTDLLADEQIFFGNGFTLTYGVWHKFVARVKMNTAGVANGILQVWVDDIQRINASAAIFRKTGQTFGISSVFLSPVYGGGTSSGNVPQTQYMWFDDFAVQTTPFGGDEEDPVDQTAPFVDTFSPGDGATGVPQSTTSFSFHARDGGAVVSGVAADNISLSCGALGGSTSITGTSSDRTVTRSGFTLSYEQSVSCTVNVVDSAGNAMTTYTYNWTVEADSTPALNITTTTLSSGVVGTPYSFNLASENGTTPITWDNTTTGLPPGLSIPSSGVGSGGTPTGAGTYNFTVRATDAVSATDTQALSLVIAPLLPQGQTSVTWDANIHCAIINSGAPTTNYYGSQEDYQWPAYTPANRTICVDNVDTLPDNVSVTSATARRRVSGWEGSGGTNPMRTNVYRITANVPDLTTLTWNNFSGTLSSAVSYTDVPLATGWFEWNILSAVQAAYAAGVPIALLFDGGNNGAADTNRVYDDIVIEITYTQLTGPGEPSIPAPGKIRISSGKFIFR